MTSMRALEILKSANIVQCDIIRIPEARSVEEAEELIEFLLNIVQQQGK